MGSHQNWKTRYFIPINFALVLLFVTYSILVVGTFGGLKYALPLIWVTGFLMGFARGFVGNMRVVSALGLTAFFSIGLLLFLGEWSHFIFVLGAIAAIVAGVFSSGKLPNTRVILGVAIIAALGFGYSIFLLPTIIANRLGKVVNQKWKVVDVISPHGDTVSTAEFQHPLVLSVWASWCGPCKAEIATLANHSKDIEDAGLKVYLINHGSYSETFEVYKHYVDSAQYPFSTFYSPKAAYSDSINLQSLPTLLVTNELGEVIYRHHGYSNDEDLVGILTELNP